MYYSMLMISCLLIISQALTGTLCRCSQLIQQTDCQSQNGCIFVNQNSQKFCAQVKFIPDCPFFSADQKECDENAGCAWNNNSTCGDFTQCSDYTIKSGQKGDLCYFKDSTCIPGQLENDGSINCKTDAANCQIITDKTICNKVSLGKSSQCYWSNKQNQCITQDYSKCSTITDRIFCTQQQCKYQNSICSAPTCADINKGEKCTSVRANENQRFQICVWKEEKCYDANDTSHLNNLNCYINTGKTYYWNNQTCEPCMNDFDNDQTALKIGLSVTLSAIFLILIVSIIIFYIKWKKQKGEKEAMKIYQLARSIRFYKDIRPEENINERNCCFCRGEFQREDEVEITLCKHLFHHTCLEGWKQVHNQCPICNTLINQG